MGLAALLSILAIAGPAAAEPGTITLEVTIRGIKSDLAPGSYAVSVFHDANGNGKLDTFVGIPKEGYGFSRNPPFRPRAPRFDEAQVDLTGNSSTVITLRYLL
jgi:uncharacterized protein (DUF2141 family)